MSTAPTIEDLFAVWEQNLPSVRLREQRGLHVARERTAFRQTSRLAARLAEFESEPGNKDLTEELYTSLTACAAAYPAQWSDGHYGKPVVDQSRPGLFKPGIGVSD